jgi:tetratricopeptide (TPR) repeat protein
VSEKLLQDAKKRRSAFGLTPTIADLDETLNQTTDSATSYNDFTNYLTDNAERIKEKLNERANAFYQMSLKEFKEKNYSRTIQTLNKAIALNSVNISYYFLKYEAFVQLCDFNCALLTINKIISVMQLWPNKSDHEYNELKIKLTEKLIFCHYMMGQSYFDLKLYSDALNSFNKASELQPNNLLFKIRR